METPTGHDQNADQIAFWNGLAGQHWTDRQQAQDTILAPVSDILIDRAKPSAGERIVDVGCGCGRIAAIDANASDTDRKGIMVRLNELLNRRSYIRNLVTNVQKELQ